MWAALKRELQTIAALAEHPDSLFAIVAALW